MSYTGPPPMRFFVAKPNYSYEKRQRDLAKQRKKEEKRKKKAARRGEPESGSADADGDRQA